MKYDNWTKAKKDAELIRLKKKRDKITKNIDRDIELLSFNGSYINITDYNDVFSYSEPCTLTSTDIVCTCGKTIRTYGTRPTILD